jgi:Holliday junction resolvase RusA-like endonuclease
MTDDCAIIYLSARPPSTNNIYVNVPGKGRMKSRDYRNWQTSQGWEIITQRPKKFYTPVHLIITAAPSKRSKEDASNLTKPIEDLLVQQGILPDDGRKYVTGVTSQWATRPLLRGSACVIIISKSIYDGLHLLNEVYERAETA